MTKSLEGLIKPFIAFDRPVDAPAHDPDVGKMHTVCFNEEWLPYILGALGALTRPETYRAASYDDINLAAQRGMHLLDMFMGECQVGVFYQTILREAPDFCGIQWSNDNGDTWNDINLTPCITDLIDLAIEHAITNGVLAVPGQPGPLQSPIPPGGSVAFHAQHTAGEQWLIPVPISSGDTIEVTDASGAWNSFENPLSDWCCPNGQMFYLGMCGQLRQPYRTDPNQNAWHMELMLNVNGTWYLPLRGAVTVPAGVSDVQAFFQPNQSNLNNGAGQIIYTVIVTKAGNP